MPTEEISEGNPIEIKRVFGFADFLYVLLLFVMYAFLYSDSAKALNASLKTIQNKSQQTADTGKEPGK